MPYVGATGTLLDTSECEVAAETAFLRAHETHMAKRRGPFPEPCS